MIDFYKYAIVLIYSNGEIEHVPITSFKTHLDYFRVHLTKSKRFAKLVRGCDFKDYLYASIERALLKSKIVVMYNINICDILGNSLWLDNHKSNFIVCLPSRNFHSKEQFEAYHNIFSNYLTEYASYGIFNENTNKRFKAVESINYQDMLDIIEAEKEKYDLEYKR